MADEAVLEQRDLELQVARACAARLCQRAVRTPLAQRGGQVVARRLVALRQADGGVRRRAQAARQRLVEAPFLVLQQPLKYFLVFGQRRAFARHEGRHRMHGGGIAARLRAVAQRHRARIARAFAHADRSAAQRLGVLHAALAQRDHEAAAGVVAAGCRVDALGRGRGRHARHQQVDAAFAQGRLLRGGVQPDQFELHAERACELARQRRVESIRLGRRGCFWRGRAGIASHAHDERAALDDLGEHRALGQFVQPAARSP
ncbi:hypothetical protein FHT32_001498 [Variovorax sp. SG517]|nr:hypothetical protein [Variovorax sp. SG517]